MRSSIDRRTLALLIASSLFLSMIDHLIPKPVPFFRLGLANLPVLIALPLCRPADLARLALFKIVGQGVLTGMLFSYVFLLSAAGTLTSVAVMWTAYRSLDGRISLIGVSALGALASNTVQLVFARFVVFGSGVILLAPPLYLTGLITSVLLGVVANRFIATSRWFALVSTVADQPVSDTDPDADEARGDRD